MNTAIVLCNRCKRQILPKQPGNHFRDAHRGTNAIVEKDLDSDVEKAKRKKERRERGKQLRQLIRSGDIHAAQRLIYTPSPLPSSDECPDCVALQRAS